LIIFNRKGIVFINFHKNVYIFVYLEKSQVFREEWREKNKNEKPHIRVAFLSGGG